MSAASKTVRVYETLKRELLNNEHPSGAKLAIDQVAERLDVSRGAVREALSRLTSDHLVVSQPQRGFAVAPTSEADLRDLTAVRIEIETRCLRRSIECGTLAWEGRLIGIWHQLRRTEPGKEGDADETWSQIHARFHDELIAGCDSAWWMRLRTQLYMQAERYRRMILPRARVARDINSEHQRILDLTLARDADAACAALAEHLDLTARILLASGAPELAGGEGKDGSASARRRGQAIIKEEERT